MHVRTRSPGDRFPLFERQDLRQLLLAGGALGRRPRRVRGLPRDWDENGAPWEYWVERTEAARAAFAGLIGAEPDEVAVTTSVSAGVSGARQRAALRGARRRSSYRARVPDDRPDLARAGVARRAGRPRASRTTRRLRRGDRRRHRARRHHARLATGPARCSTSRGVVGLAREHGRARPARRLPGGRLDAGRRRRSSASTSSARACSSTCSAPPGSRSSTAAASSSGARLADRDRLVRRRERLQDGHPRLLARADARAASSRGRRRCRPSTRASPGSG